MNLEKMILCVIECKQNLNLQISPVELVAQLSMLKKDKEVRIILEKLLDSGKIKLNNNLKLEISQ